MWGFKKNTEKEQKKAAKKTAELRAQAMKNARAAREAIGEETLERIAAAMGKMQEQNARMQQARKQIGQADKARVADEIKWMMGDR